MKAKRFVSFLVASVLILTSAAAVAARADSRDCRYFKETGHYVCGQYLEYFNARGGLEIFGFPLTEAFDDPTHGGLRVQYFQRARMELHRDGSGSRIMLGLLVDELGYTFPAVNPDQVPSSNSPTQHYFPETGHIVSHAFLRAFRDKGGLEIFGYPRSEFFYENGVVVQYFQRARMEWYSDRPPSSQIELANVGEIYLERFGVPGDYDEPAPPPARKGSAAAASPTDAPPVGAPTAGAPEDCEYFPETGHHVCDAFLHYYRAKGGSEIFGSPLTAPFNDPDHGGLRVQYFERARMELHPDGAGGHQVLLGLLVDELGYTFPPVAPDQIPATNTSRQRYFPETKHVVSHAFLFAFREKGGLEIFGYPRSELLYEDGHIVQYFQRARMEWRPKNEIGSQIELTELGRVYLERFDVPEVHRRPRPRDGAATGSGGAGPSTVIKLDLSASVEHPITGPEGTQTIFVHVVDQQGQPVAGAEAAAQVRYPSRQEQVMLPATDESGFTRKSFDLVPSPPGQKVVIEVTVTYADLSGTTQASFLPWH
jgi:hypothetical protein